MAERQKRHSPAIERVVEILRERVAESGRSCRAIEIEAKWPLGTLALLLAGRTPVTLDQLETLAEIFSFRVFDVMLEVYGPRFEDNAPGRLLRSVVKKDPSIAGLLLGSSRQ